MVVQVFSGDVQKSTMSAEKLDTVYTIPNTDIQVVNCYRNNFVLKVRYF